MSLYEAVERATKMGLKVEPVSMLTREDFKARGCKPPIFTLKTHRPTTDVESFHDVESLIEYLQEHENERAI